MGGAGLFTRIRPYKVPTPRPTTKDMNKTFIAFPLHIVLAEDSKDLDNVTHSKGAYFVSVLELQSRGPDDGLDDFYVGWLLDGVGYRSSN